MLYEIGDYSFDVYVNRNGYYIDKETNEYVHRLIAMDKFDRDYLESWEVVRHIDWNKLNNDPDNLYICSWGFHSLIHRYKITKSNFWSFVYKMKSRQRQYQYN